MPKWGLAMHEGTLTAWHVAEGSAVSRGDELCDIETAKIANAFEAPQSGVLVRRLVAPGEVVAVGRLIAVLADAPVDETELAALLAAEAAVASQSEAVPAPALSQVATARGPIAYVAAGDPDAAPVVLLHGFGGDHASWGLVQAELAATCRAIALDLPGHGASTKDVGDGSATTLAEAVAEALAALCKAPAHLVAHSFGAAVGRALVAGGFDARATTLLAPAGFGCPADAEYVSGFAAARRKRELRPLMARLFARPEELGREMVSASLALLDDKNSRAALQRVAAALVAAPTGSPSWPAERNWQVLWGGHDQVIRLGPEVTAVLGRRLHLLPECGHMLPLEAPATVVHRILALQASAIS
jgi:pyruvate dehydrogenase E2 component (dihydrolipoamide acetyltransferase)